MDNNLRDPFQIVRKILEHVSSQELLQISFVNKLWKSEARSVVRQRGSFIARLKCETNNIYRYDTCQGVEAFVSDLHKTEHVFPLCAISIQNDYEQHICARPIGAAVPIYDVNLDHLPLRSLSVEIGGPWLSLMNCPALLLVKKLFRQFSGVLEELELNISDAKEDFIDKVVQDCNFPRLKILDVKLLMWRSNENNESYIKGLLSRAPNLKVLHTNWDINSALELLQGTSVWFVYTSHVRAPFDEISENVISAIRLEKLELEYTGQGFNFERFNRIAPMLVQASCTTTLREIFVDAVLAVSLMCFGIRLENVKNLQMDIDYRCLELTEPRILNIVKKIDFTRIVVSYRV